MVLRTLRAGSVAAVLVATAAGSGWAQGAASHPGASQDSAFSGRGGPAIDGTAILNVDSGFTFPTIQAAIDAASAGDTLEVQAAVHSEGQVLVDRDLTLRGATGVEIVEMAVDTGSAGDDRAWFLVDTAVDLVVEDLIFDGDGRLVHQAFRHRGTGRFERSQFRDIQFNPDGPNFAGTAIVAFGGNVEVVECTFSDIGRVGVFFFGAGVTAGLAESNVFTGKGDGSFLDYGIEVGGGATATLRDNLVTDCRGEAPDGSTSGAVLATTFFAAGTTATVENNTFVDNTSGMLAGGPGGADTTVFAAAFNRIASNAFGLTTTAPGTVAENNWWGCNDGPGGVGCDGLAGPEAPDTDPWLVLGLGADPTSVPSGGQSLLTADLRFNSDAQDTSGLGAIADGTPVTFDAGAGSVAPVIGDTIAGTAQSTYIAPNSGGLDPVSATLDNQTVSLEIEVIGGPAITVPTLAPAGLIALALAIVAIGVRRLRAA